MQDFGKKLKAVSDKNLEQKKTWYSPVADLYYRARPKYPQQLITQAVTLARLDSNSTILEIGCGPGNATIPFARLGALITCIEPNQEFYHLARQNCLQYTNVRISHTSFEEWTPKNNKFDAVLSANAFHWILPEIGYAKAADVLKDDGYLILLWNLTPEPRYEVYQTLQEIYQVYAPSFVRYEGASIQAAILEKFEQNILDSGYFGHSVSEQVSCKVTYSINKYLELLSTLRQLEPQTQDILFIKLREKLSNWGNKIELYFLSAIHVARKSI